MACVVAGVTALFDETVQHEPRIADSGVGTVSPLSTVPPGHARPRGTVNRSTATNFPLRVAIASAQAIVSGFCIPKLFAGVGDERLDRAAEQLVAAEEILQLDHERASRDLGIRPFDQRACGSGGTAGRKHVV